MSPKVLTGLITIGTAFLAAWIRDLKAYKQAKDANPELRYDFLILLISLLESLQAGIPGGAVVAMVTPDG